MVAGQREVSLFIEKPRVAIGYGICDITSGRDRHIVVQLPVPELNLRGNIRKPITPGVGV